MEVIFSQSNDGVAKSTLEPKFSDSNSLSPTVSLDSHLIAV